jgi:aerobic-type carbon monoxide dehydrogenase small subunit (CoxS/CutS family)
MAISEPRESMDVRFRVNGRTVTVQTRARTLLADLLRERLGLTGVHLGCEQGVCGACTVLLNGDAVRSCLLLAPQAHGADITTVEGLADGGGLTDIQQAFRSHHALQCAFCTPGLLMSATALLEEVDRPSDEQIMEIVCGHICRCTGYEGIVAAIRDVAARDSGDADA